MEVNYRELCLCFHIFQQLPPTAASSTIGSFATDEILLQCLQPPDPPPGLAFSAAACVQAL